MRRIHADDRHARARQRAAGYGEVEREGAATADDLAVFECRVHPSDVEHLRETLEPLFVRCRTEVLPDPEDRVAVLLKPVAGAHLESHAASLTQPIFSSG